MIIDYPGQELIWNLTETHPYKQNRGNYKIMIRCQTPLQNKKWYSFFKKHLGGKLKIQMTRYIDKNTGLERFLCEKISIPNALGGEGEVEFINEFARGVKE